MHVHQLCKRFGQAVGQCLEHNGVVVIVLRLVLGDSLVDADSRCHGKCAEVVWHTGAFRRDIIGKTMVEAVRRFDHLLAQKMKSRAHHFARFVCVNLDIIANAVRWIQPEDGICSQPFFINDARKHFFRILEQIACGFSNDFIAQDFRVAPGKLPCLKKWRPVDHFRNLCQRIVSQYLGTEF